jgi:hypothetical protein
MYSSGVSPERSTAAVNLRVRLFLTPFFLPPVFGNPFGLGIESISFVK